MQLRLLWNELQDTDEFSLIPFLSCFGLLLRFELEAEQVPLADPSWTSPAGRTDHNNKSQYITVVVTSRYLE